MDILTIFLGVLLVVIIFYFTFNSGEQELSKKLDLGQPQTNISGKSLDQPASAKYSYEMWLYVYQYESSGEKYIISRKGSTDTTKNIGIKIGGNGQPQLKLEYESAANATNATNATNVVITNNLPLQTWVHLIVSVDGYFVDVYMNGKLVKSFQDSSIKAPQGETVDIEYGDAKCYLAKLTRTTKATDPQTAWNKYMAGNGENPFAKMMSSFGLTMTLQKNNQDYSKITLF